MSLPQSFQCDQAKRKEKRGGKLEDGFLSMCVCIFVYANPTHDCLLVISSTKRERERDASVYIT